MHINRIKNNNDNIKNTHNKSSNKLHIENKSANSITKKTHIKVFNDTPKKVKSIDNTHIDYDKHNVLKQIKQVIKVHNKTNNAFINLDKCKKAHKKLFINVLNQLRSNNNVQEMNTHLQILSMKCIFVILIMIYYYIITYYIMLVK